MDNLLSLRLHESRVGKFRRSERYAKSAAAFIVTRWSRVSPGLQSRPPTMNPPGFRALKVSLGQVNLDAALRCGQSFRWTRHSLPHTVENGETEWRYCARDRVLCLRQTPSHIFYKAVFPDGLQTSERDTDTAAWLHDYLQLNTDLEALYTTWAESDPVFASLRHRFKGIRMLRQDPWETLVSFICSSNNQISRITSMVQNLSTHFCPPLLTLPDPNEPSKTLSYHSFPHPSMLAAPSVSSKLRALGFGYRAEFIQRTAKMLVDLHGSDRAAGDLQEPAEKWLLTLRDMETAVARQELLKFVGVGRKVADCIGNAFSSRNLSPTYMGRLALMALDKHEVIPVDTHVQQIAVKHYKLKGIKAKTAMSPKLYEEVATRLTAVWGEYAGWAHSVRLTVSVLCSNLTLTPTSGVVHR